MPTPALKILVVDHIVSMRRTIRHLLRQLGHETIIDAVNGEDAITLLESRVMDVAIAAWDIPPTTGLGLLKAIRSHDTLHNVPVLLMFAEVNEENVTAAVQAGVSGILVKPFSADALGKKLQALFASKMPKQPEKGGRSLQQLLAPRY